LLIFANVSIVNIQSKKNNLYPGIRIYSVYFNNSISSGKNTNIDLRELLTSNQKVRASRKFRFFYTTKAFLVK